MKKKYLAPMSASVMVKSIVMSVGTVSPTEHAPLTPGGEGGLTPAL